MTTKTRSQARTFERGASRVQKRKHVGPKIDFSGFHTKDPALYKFLFEESPTLNVLIEQDGKISYVNKSVVEALGYSLNEIVGKNALDLVVPEERGKVGSTLEIGFKDEATPSIEVGVLAKTGAPRRILFSSGHVLLKGRHRTTSMLVAGIDVTERRQSLKAFRESEERFREAMEATNDGLWDWNVETDEIYFSPAYNRMLGYQPGKLPEHIQSWKDLIHPDDRGRAVRANEDCIANRISHFEVEFRMKSKSGEWKWILGRGKATARAPNGRALRMIGTHVDITERKRMEDKLLALHKHALQLGTASNADETANYTLDAIEFALGFDYSYFLLVEGDCLQVKGSRGRAVAFSAQPLDGRGVTVKAANTKTTLRISDTRNEPAYVDPCGYDWNGPPTVASELVVPVLVDDKTTAVLCVDSVLRDAFTDEDQRLLETLAIHVGSELKRLKQSEELRRHATHLEELVEERSKELAENERRFRELADLLPQIVFEIDLNGDITFVNRASLTIMGYTDEELRKGLNAFQMFIARDRERVRDNMQMILGGENPGSREYTMLRKDGSTFPALIDSAPIIRAGKPVGLRGFVIDITERKRVEEDLRAARERLDHVITSTPAVIFTGTPHSDLMDFEATYISSSVKSMLGYGPEQFTRDPKFWRGHIHPNDLDHALLQLPRILKTGRGGYEYRFLHGDGSYRWVHEELTVVQGSDGKPSEVIGYVTDVTDQKRLEERLFESERLAAIGRTAAMVGHDLRNPLQGIAGAVNLLKQESLTTKEKSEMLQLIQNNVEYSDSIVRDLTEYAAQIQLKLVEATPKSIARYAMKAIKVPDNVALQDLSEDRPRLKVDQDMMKRVFINLVENAIEAMPQGGNLTLRSNQSDGAVEIALSDTGSGIPDLIMRNLWKPLQTTKAKGLGLGLAICKRIIDAHGGEISVKSELDGGTTVTIRLPIDLGAVEVVQQ